MTKKLLITDLDNTLYDWVTFFTKSFHAMVGELTKIIDISEEQILSEFRVVHQRYGNSEQPFAVLELPSVKRQFPGASPSELARQVDSALHKFNSTRKRTLVLYPGCVEVLKELNAEGIKIVGHTEAILANAYWRLRALGVDQYLKRLYTLEGMDAIHVSNNSTWVEPPSEFVTVLPRHERKPNPRLLSDICSREGFSISDAYYLGDSLVRDMSMAKAAGVKAIWARFGTKYDPNHWTYLVKVTHWTEQDVAREKDLKEKFSNIKPDFVIDSFLDLPNVLLSQRGLADHLVVS
jgi:FMN phosphatase YigB (HAD superfamily)